MDLGDTMLKKEIQKLISMKQEGPYWDFKKQWYIDKMDLLHDIICMANNLENRDAYIIIGVDEEHEFGLVDTTQDKNRWNTQIITDFLSGKIFAGGVRPQVLVEAIQIQSTQFDVIIIKNSLHTPFYLTKNYKRVHSNNIYTRVMDTNTPINKSADIQNVEYLWKKRFRLLSPPLERINYYLENRDEWIEIPTDWRVVGKYNKYFPEFTIEYTLDDIGNGYQYYLFNQSDSRPHWREIRLYYHQTLLYSTEGISLDGGRYFTPTPYTDGISFDNYRDWDVMFKYFTKDSLEYTIHKFYYSPDGDEQTIAHNKFMECMLIFSDDEEKEQFKRYILLVWHEREKYSKDIFTPYFPKIDGYRMEKFKQDYINVQILKRMQIDFITRE